MFIGVRLWINVFPDDPHPAAAELFFPFNPHLSCGHPMTRSRPLARPSRAFAFGKFLSPLPKRFKSRSHGRGIWLRLLEALEELLQGGRQFATFPVDGGHGRGVTSVFKRHRRQPPLRGLVPHEASSKIIAWSTPAKLAGNILEPARKLLV